MLLHLFSILPFAKGTINGGQANVKDEFSTPNRAHLVTIVCPFRHLLELELGSLSFGESGSYPSINHAKY